MCYVIGHLRTDFGSMAYHTALAKGTDVDQQRNVAKSVTVE